MRESGEIFAEIKDRFGFLPPFFSPAEETPEVLEHLWRQTLSAYVNNPLPALFKEKLFAYLSRYCTVPYCIVCHSCALRPLGMTAQEVLDLLDRSSPRESEIEEKLAAMVTLSGPLSAWPEPHSPIEESLFLCSISIFLKQDHAERYRSEVRRLLGPAYYNHLLMFLSYVKMCHLWVESHPELVYETDKRAQDHLRFLLSEAPALADFFRDYQGRMGRERRRREDRLMEEIAERKAAEEALAEGKERLAVTLRSIGDGVIATDTEGKIVFMNPVAEKLTGWTDEASAGRPLAEVFYIVNEKSDERCENPVEKVLRNGGIVGLANHTALIAKDGTRRSISDSGAPIRDRGGKIIGVVLVFRDVTERRRMQEELLKTAKLEAVGLLAGGIAHDFNNILTAILGNISLAKHSVDPKEALFELLTQAERASLRAKDLSHQLLTLSKGGAPIKRAVLIAQLLEESTRFALRGSNVQCEFSLPPDLWPVEIDEGQISQVIHNLTINAQQAMPEGGTLRIAAENRIVRGGGEGGLPLKEGNYIRISIQDTGIGIPKEHLNKIFDPYFTTKQKGSGLGLSTAYSIMKNHDGEITVESEPEIGTTFSLYLPAFPEKRVPRKEAEERPKTGGGRILVMDDEEIVREVAGRMLRAMGYEVGFAKDGAEAIALYREAWAAGQPFDAVILDLTVPGGMGGKEAVRKLIEIEPHVKAIASSGYSSDLIMADFGRYGFCDVLVKPYQMAELSSVLLRAMKR